jgi:very-short-patch-repair endonuclease
MPDGHLTARARALRRDAVPAERALWLLLKRDQLCGLRFRRQHVIGHYIVDFYCPARRLVIEIDGRSHDAQRFGYDQAREAYLRDRGYTVLRFPDLLVLRDPVAVVRAIAVALELDG